MPIQTNEDSGRRSWDITGKGVPVAVVVGAMLLTATTLLGFDKIMDGRIDSKLSPISESIRAVQGQQSELLKILQEIREEQARYQEREKIERSIARDNAIKGR